VFATNEPVIDSSVDNPEANESIFDDPRLYKGLKILGIVFIDI